MRVSQFSLRTLLVATAIVALAISARSYWMLPAGMLLQKTLRPVESLPIEWQPFSPERLAAARRSGKPVLVHFDADWDYTTKWTLVNGIEKPSVRRLVADYDVICIKANITEPDKAAEAEAKKYGPAIAPLTVIHSPSGKMPIVRTRSTKRTLTGGLT